jgi:hypothetical protein
MTPVANFATCTPDVVVDTGRKFATGVNDNDGIFAAGFNYTCGKLLRYQGHQWHICHQGQ